VTDSPDIGGRSRRFQAAVIAVTLLALLAGALAAASLSGSGDILDLGSSGGGRRILNREGAGGGGGGGSGGGGDGGNLPGFVEDIFGWLGDGRAPADVNPGEVEVPPPPYDITVEPEPTPGARVVVTVEKSGDPVPFALVSFNGEPVGRTAPTGQMLARVPYTDQLRVTAVPPDTDGGGGSDPVGPSGTPSHLGAGVLAQTGGSNSSATYDVQTNATARVDGVALPGETATVQFLVAGNPLPGVGVTSNGEGVGITDRSGTVEFEIPPGAPLGGSVPVELVREGFTDDTEVEVADIEVGVNTGLLAVPSTGATVEVTAVDSTGSEPVADAPVTVTDSGERVAGGRTGENGTVSFTLPWSNDVTATATTEYGTASTTVRGILLQFVGAAVALALPVVGAVVWARGNPATRRRWRERLVGAMLAAGRALEGAARRVAALPVGDAVRRVWGRLVRAVGWLWAGVGRLGAGLRGRSWLPVVLAGPRWLLGRLQAGLAALAGRLFGGEKPAEQPRPAGRSAETPAAEIGATQEPQSAYGRLRRYWLWLVRRVVGRTAGRTKTPVEIERRAIKKGLPADAVRRLRRAFQAVEYGPADAEERVDDAESARGRLEQEREEDSESNA